MIPGKAIAAAVVIFTAGLVSGGMGVQFLRARNQPAAPAKPPGGGPPMPWVGQRVEFIRRVSDRLGLSAEQRERIDQHIRESQQRMRELWEKHEPQFKAEVTRVREQVDAELTPAQREQFAQLQKERQAADRNANRWRDPRRRGPGGEGEPADPARAGTNQPPPGMHPAPPPP